MTPARARRQLAVELLQLRDRLRALERPEGHGGHGYEAAAYDELLEAHAIEQERLLRRAAQLDSALDRIDAGVWGKCDECSEAIHPARMAAVPDAARCIACQRTHEAEARHAAPLWAPGADDDDEEGC